MAKERTEEVRRWVTLSELKASLSPTIAEVLKGKRPCLLQTLLTEAGPEDLGLVDDIKKGFDLTGALPRSGVFTQKFRLASMTCDDLRRVSHVSRSVLLESVQSSGDRETDAVRSILLLWSILQSPSMKASPYTP